MQFVFVADSGVSNIKALILNSGLGRRMGEITKCQPKCMTKISAKDTILSRQLRQLIMLGVQEVVITTGAFSSVLVNYVQSLELPLSIEYVCNPDYAESNYIWSIYLARDYLQDDILLLHGDLVCENEVFYKMAGAETSVVAVSSTTPLPGKDFKAVFDARGKVKKIGVEFFEQAMASQPLYRLKFHDWFIWLKEIQHFCERGERSCYAEKALNQVSDKLNLYAMDIKNMLCQEVDTPEDLQVVSSKLSAIDRRTVYLSFSTDVIHSGHIKIIKKAQGYGRVIIGVLTDKAVVSYKRLPMVPYEERSALFANIAGVWKVVPQTTLSYRENIEKYHPDIVVHGDDWRQGVQKPVRDEVVSLLAEYGGRLLEFPYAEDVQYQALERRLEREMSLPDWRRSRLRKAISLKGLVTAIEAHSGLTGLLAEKTVVYEQGEARQFDAMWISSLCDSTAKGKPDIELVDMTSRYRTVDDIVEVTTKPIIFDGDTGGLKEHFVYTVRTLERMGVSMIIIEDKKGLKKNSLFGTEVRQTQEDIAVFCDKIRAGKAAQKTTDFMICARIESLILEKGMNDALVRAKAFVEAGADAIMIHSRKHDPAEIFSFVEAFRAENKVTPLVVVPTAFNQVTEEEFYRRGVNVVIYANQLTRTGFPAMQRAAETILRHHRALECDAVCMPFKDIIRLIPEDLS